MSKGPGLFTDIGKKAKGDWTFFLFIAISAIDSIRYHFS